MTGLSNEEVVKSREKYGSNEVNVKNKNTFFRLLIESLGDPMIRILLIVLVIKLVFIFADESWFETLGIFIAIFFATLISTLSEYGSNKAFNRLFKENNIKECKVKRDNNLKIIKISEVVVGDIIYLNGGDYVPADGVLVDGEISLDEASISGESKDIQKKINDKIFKGTTVTSGEAIMKVTLVGENTMHGAITMELSDVSENSPLKTRLTHLARIISTIGYIGAFLVFFSYLFSVIVIANKFNLSLIIKFVSNIPSLINHIIYAITLAVTIIVVSVPEGLPLMVALVLSTNMKKMIKKNVLVKKMVGIETAGSLNVLLSDKTGTLTNGKLSLYGVVTHENKMFNDEIEITKYSEYYRLVGNACVLNNDAIVSENNIINGNATDKAIIKFFSYKPVDKIIRKESFSSDKKYSSVETKEYVYYKGAPDVIIPRCKYSYFTKKELIDKNRVNNIVSRYMNKGFRVIALAYKSKVSDDLIYLGCILLKDEIRKDAKNGVKLIKSAGVNLIMVTGDSLDTAMYIGRELDLYKDGDVCLTSSDLSLMSDDELKTLANRLKIVARAKPTDKSRLVRIFKELNLVVGMTGDGINDAAALKKCDVGFAMGSGADVAKEAADIVILDDNISSISMAILFGRTIFKNIRKFIIFQLTVNICAMSLSIVGPFIGISTPVTVMQMLWINMIMDSLASLAFAYENPSLEYMNEKPKNKNEHIINKYMYGEIIITGLFSSLLCILFLKLPIFKELIRFDIDNKYFLTAFFTLFVFIGIFNAFNARTSRLNLFSNILGNKVFIIIFTLVSVIQIYFIYHGGSLFRTYGLTLKELLICLGLAFTVIPFDLLRKYLIGSKDYV